MQRILVKVNNQSPGLYTIVLDKDVDHEGAITRVLSENGINHNKGYRILSSSPSGIERK